jgi:hypothetical protein
VLMIGCQENGSQVCSFLRRQYYRALEVSCTFVENQELPLAAQNMQSSLFEASYELKQIAFASFYVIMKQILYCKSLPLARDSGKLNFLF